MPLVEDERRDDEEAARALAASKLSRALADVSIDEGDAHEEALKEAVVAIRSEKPGLVAKQVHTELMARGEQWANTTLSEVKRMCSKVAKAEVQENISQAGSGLSKNPEKALAEVMVYNGGYGMGHACPPPSAEPLPPAASCSAVPARRVAAAGVYVEWELLRVDR